MVDGYLYKPKVSEPSIAQTVSMKKDEVRKILAFKLFQGQETTKNGSTFTGYSAKVHTINDVINGYKQLKYRFLDATHIMCAYWIMDPGVAHHKTV